MCDLACVKPTLLACRCQEQTGFTPKLFDHRQNPDSVELGRAQAQIWDSNILCLYGPLNCIWFAQLCGCVGLTGQVCCSTEANITYAVIQLTVYLLATDSEWFIITSGVCHGWVTALDSFTADMHWLVERSAGRGMSGVYLWTTYVYWSWLCRWDDVSLLAELLELLIPVLEVFREEVAPLRSEVNLQKTVVQTIGLHERWTFQSPSVWAWCLLSGWVYLPGFLMRLICSSEPQIRNRSVMTWTAMQSLDRHLWRLHIATWTKLRLYNVYILPIMLYGSKSTLTVNKADAQWIDAFDQWCLQWILNIHRHNFVRNVCCLTKQPPLSSIIRSWCLSLFRHVAHMDMTEDATKYSLGPHQSFGEDLWLTMLCLAQEYHRWSDILWPGLLETKDAA